MVQWTPDQQKAIDARKGTLLVSAAAGSGKTAVLVERVIRRICDKENPCDVENLLIVTFTNAAVGELRERIGDAIKKAIEDAKKNLIYVPRVGTTIPHEVNGHFGAGKILIMPAKQGTGVIAGGPARAVLELAGLTDVRAKSLGSNNPRNMVNATIEGLNSLKTVEEIERKKRTNNIQINTNH